MKRLALALLVVLSASRLDAATITVCPSSCTYTNAQLQTAINAAASGDTITLNAGDTYTGNFTLPAKGNGAVITIKSNASAGSLPGVGVRTSPAYAAFLPKIQASAGAPAFQFLANAQKYTLENLEFLGNPGGFNTIINVGNNDSTQYLTSQEPTTLVFDRLYIHADPVTGQKVAFTLSGNHLTIANSYVTNIHGVGQDTQCIAGTNGSGDWTITNNYLKCGTENILVGGVDPNIRTYLTVTGSATTTGAAVQTVEANHTLAELASGQQVAIETPTGVEFATLTAQPGSGTTGTLAWSPAVSGVPAVNARVRGGVDPLTIAITGNHLTKDLAWLTDGVLTRPTLNPVTASTASGSLAAGTWCYRLQAASTAGYQNATVKSDVSAEQCGTLSATGKNTLGWTDITGETSYLLWRFTAPGATVGESISLSAGTTTYVDDASGTFTSGAYTAGTRIQEKNLIELKMGRSVTISGNVFEYQWKGSDIGSAVWLKSVNQDGNCWWCQTRDVTLENNIFRHIDGWLLISGRESYSGNPRPPSLTAVTLRHNLVYDSDDTWSQGVGAPCAMKVFNATVDLHLEHNTLVHQGCGFLQIGGSPTTLIHTGLIVRNNLGRKESYGVIGDGTGEGTSALTTWAPGAILTANALANATCSLYPAGNFCEPNAAWEAEYVAYSLDGTNADYHLKTTSPYHLAGTDGTDLGADLTAVFAATAGAVQGVTTSPPTITTTGLPNAVRTVVYPSTTLQATGGTVPLTWSVNTGSTLPTGLAFSSGGVLSGTPTATAGSYTFTLKVVDNAALPATQTYTITITNSTAITTTTLASAEKDLRYAVTLGASGDAAPFTWTVTTGSLPLGMTLTGAGLLSGTPTVAGTSNFSVRATGSLGSVSAPQALSLVVGSETRPCDRNIANNRSSGFLYRSKTAPVDGPPECPMRGDVWVDTSQAMLSINLATAVNPVVWTPLTTLAVLTGDGSLLTNLNAAAVQIGRLPAAALPGAGSFETSVTTPLVTSDYLALNQTACATIAGSGTLRLCADAVTGQLLVSINGGVYTAIGTGAATTAGNFYVNPNAVDNIKISAEIDHNTDTYSAGMSTVKGAKIYFDSPLGARRQFLAFGDTNADSENYFRLGHSSNSGASYIYDFGVRHDGFLLLHNAPWNSSTAPTISSGFGTTPTIASHNGTSSFRVNVGTGGTATSGVVGLPTATNGWNCTVYDLTAQAAHTADRRTVVTASTTTTVSIENQIVSTGATAGAPWAASDILVLQCSAY